MKMMVQHFPSTRMMAVNTADYIVETARESVGKKGYFTLVLSGGSSPRPLYELLATPGYADAIPWCETHLFWGDERCVPPDNPMSNYRMACDTFIRYVSIPEENVHRIYGELDSSDDAVLDYEREIDGFFSACDEGYSGTPSFDLILLGLGSDGHTASLFPGSPALLLTDHAVVAADAPESAPVPHRITMTLQAICNAGRVVFFVSGAGKKAIVRSILAGDGDSLAYPASMVRAQSDLVWFTDLGADAGGVILDWQEMPDQ